MLTKKKIVDADHSITPATIPRGTHTSRMLNQLSVAKCLNVSRSERSQWFFVRLSATSVRISFSVLLGIDSRAAEDSRAAAAWYEVATCDSFAKGPAVDARAFSSPSSKWSPAGIMKGYSSVIHDCVVMHINSGIRQRTLQQWRKLGILFCLLEPICQYLQSTCCTYSYQCSRSSLINHFDANASTVAQELSCLLQEYSNVKGRDLQCTRAVWVPSQPCTSCG